MTAPAPGQHPADGGESLPETEVLMAAIRAAGACRFDPVRFHHAEVLARRAAAQHGSVRRLLDAKVANLLASLKADFEQAQHEAKEALERALQQYPQAASELQQRYDRGDVKGLHRMIASLRHREAIGPLAELVRELERQAADIADVQRPTSAGAHSAPPGGNRPELKAIREFRDTWSKLSVDKQVAEALEQAPRNAGPINSHMLVLRSLALMREISPDYLNRFMSYADTLLSLDQQEKDRPVTPKKMQPPRAAKR